MPDVSYVPAATIRLKWGNVAGVIMVLGIAMHEIRIEQMSSVELRIVVKRLSLAGLHAFGSRAVVGRSNIGQRRQTD